ncbi:MAG: hypothetical protein OEL55_06030 [Desulfobulbaceae bacterium]|nr:hypothetical protein [Desulfobulbaceae bacterium]
MHNSQEGLEIDPDGPRAGLLKSTCKGCHSNSVNDSTVVESNGSIIPMVFNTSSEPTNPLAGGNFYWMVFDGGDRMGHNVLDTSTLVDATLGMTPPGGTELTGSRMSCAGTTGCHGNHLIVGSGNGGSDTTAMSGAHHSADNTIDGSTIGKSFRFLEEVDGIEDNDWEQTPTSTEHNVYKGSARTDENDNDPPDTISSLCGRCHGDFHHGTGNVSGNSAAWGTPWVRHPTDFDMSTELNNSNIDYPSTYDTDVPIAYSNIDTPADEIIMCLSCHRAHGSPNESILRWDYRGWPANSATVTNGCGICHTDKN